MKIQSAVVAAAAILILGGGSILAHRSFWVEYDQSRPLTLNRKFVKIELGNPHSWVHFDATGADGQVTHWKAETPRPNGLYRGGWRKEWFEDKAGQDVQVR